MSASARFPRAFKTMALSFDITRFQRWLYRRGVLELYIRHPEEGFCLIVSKIKKMIMFTGLSYQPDVQFKHNLMQFVGYVSE